ncbi:hypothetical protein BO82DRAFT_212682 [Aspergillus uvarum CBS 121591]|uniref:Transcription factor TFIIIC triple barrel domain-containing protein n=1 Tax=Aspergillus uvarum CBS 121591 TaxID=1448315 RepID=A0A319CI71_9EURO|nr:hypothetical protein BO82DRAFT_212682 [Aspergillus uvarum CBS 121591]PYH84894.1 hypothetical protein BO82DRAFT_212682 [Aspergillus uvarum CBS 121591]
MSLPPPIPVDPAMLVDQPHPDSDIDSDYEYEYHPTETETVYLTLDLTSLHGPLRPPRRRQPSATAASSATATNISDEPDAADFTHVESPSDGLQILGLHTPNPIISYQNQIFSGTWADQLGTDLIFARPDEGRRGGAEERPGETAPHDPYSTHRTDHSDAPLRHGHNYDLLAAPSIKIIGRKANLISASQSSAVATAAAAATASATPGSDEGLDPSPPGRSDHPPAGLAPTVSTTGIIRAPNHPASNQMRFLERLASLKRSKGETDTVRTVFSTKRIQSDHASSLGGRALGWARTDEQLAEIQRLNELALQGDAAAMAELEALYTRLGEDVEREVESDDDDDGNDHDIEMGGVEGQPEVAGEDPTRGPSHDQYLDPEELLSQARRDTQQLQP